MEYEKRFIVFLDILGFKNMINDSVKNDKCFTQIYDALKYTSNVKNSLYDKRESLFDDFKEVSVFSDSIVISYRTPDFSIEDESIFRFIFHHIISDIANVCKNLLSKNIFVRGGISYGLMIHDNNICFGPAMIKAYKLENDIAIFPRIVFDEDLIKKGSLFNDELNRDLFFDKDDNVYYLDYISRFPMGHQPEWQKFILTAKKHIIIQLSKNHSLQVRQKYVWFANYFNKSVSQIVIGSEYLIDCSRL